MPRGTSAVLRSAMPTLDRLHDTQSNTAFMTLAVVVTIESIRSTQPVHWLSLRRSGDRMQHGSSAWQHWLRAGRQIPSSLARKESSPAAISQTYWCGSSRCVGRRVCVDRYTPCTIEIGELIGDKRDPAQAYAIRMLDSPADGCKYSMLEQQCDPRTGETVWVTQYERVSVALARSICTR